MGSDDVTTALDLLTAPALGKRQALERLVAHARLAVARGVTVDVIVDCLLEHGVRLSPDQLRAYLGGRRPPGRPPATGALVTAAGPVSALVPDSA